MRVFYLKLKLILIFSILLSIYLPSYSNIISETIGYVNGESISLKEYNRLLKAKGEKYSKEKILDLIIDRLLVLQEAKKRNTQVSEEETTKRLNQIKEKQSGEEGFTKFLTNNDATIDDVKNEIRNQLIYELTKTEILKETSFKSFLLKKKLDSDIIIYNDKINEQETGTIIEDSEVLEPKLRLQPYPSITETIEEIKLTESTIEPKLIKHKLKFKFPFHKISKTSKKNSSFNSLISEKIYIEELKEDKINTPTTQTEVKEELHPQQVKQYIKRKQKFERIKDLSEQVGDLRKKIELRNNLASGKDNE